MMERAFHPVADVFPLMSDGEIDDLATDIREHGQREPIYVHPADGAIVDGRNRYLACRRTRLDPWVETYTPEEHGPLVSFVVSLNLKRRHLNESQRAMVAAKVATLEAHRPNGSAPIGALPQDEAARMLSVGRRSVQRARTVQQRAAPELTQAVERGEVSVSAAAEVATEPHETQRELVARGEKEILRAASEIKAQRREQSRAAGHSSESVEWYTPAEIVDAAREVMGGIDLDPASCELANTTYVRAAEYVTEQQDGLKRDWPGRVWLNPPYGRDDDNRSNARLWSRYLIGQYENGPTEQAVLLVNACTGDEWFGPLWSFPICFPRRIRFFTPEGRGPSPTHSNALVYLGPNVERFLDVFSKLGRCVVPRANHSEAV